jgi:hypothetical protein
VNSREYRQMQRRRARAALLEANRKRPHHGIETERVIEFASRWAPYRGATEEEILGRVRNDSVSVHRAIVCRSSLTRTAPKTKRAGWRARTLSDREFPPPISEPRPPVLGLPQPAD